MKSVWLIALGCLVLAACSHQQASNTTLNTLQPVTKVQKPYQQVALVPFSCQKTILSKAAQAILTQSLSKVNEQSNLVLQAITPSDGSEDVNLAQGALRNKAIADFYAVHGVNLNHIQQQSFGGAYDLPSAPVNACEVIVLAN